MLFALPAVLPQKEMFFSNYTYNKLAEWDCVFVGDEKVDFLRDTPSVCIRESDLFIHKQLWRVDNFAFVRYNIVQCCRDGWIPEH